VPHYCFQSRNRFGSDCVPRVGVEGLEGANKDIAFDEYLGAIAGVDAIRHFIIVIVVDVACSEADERAVEVKFWHISFYCS
jgi:hypothetical protein